MHHSSCVLSPYSKSRNHVLHTLEKVAPSAYESCIYELVDNQVHIAVSIILVFAQNKIVCYNMQLDRAISVAKVTSDCKFVSKFLDMADFDVE